MLIFPHGPASRQPEITRRLGMLPGRTTIGPLRGSLSANILSRTSSDLRKSSSCRHRFPQPDEVTDTQGWLTSSHMNGLFSGVAARSATKSARSELSDLMATIGSSGLVAAAALPGLQTAVDQHAPAVRDSLLGDLQPMSAVSLAAYAAGVREAGAGHGWQPPLDPIVWPQADWIMLRLLAVCALNRGNGAVV